MDNLSILKLIIFQSSFMFINLEKKCLEEKDLNWFYQFYQIFFFKILKLLNIKNKNFEIIYNIHKKIFLEKKTNLEKEDFFELYNYMYNYIEENKNEYNTLTI